MSARKNTDTTSPDGGSPGRRTIAAAHDRPETPPPDRPAAAAVRERQLAPKTRRGPALRLTVPPERRARPLATPLLLRRVMIEQVSPQLDGGRFPVKRVAGDLVRVEADIYKDGHDVLKARIRYRGPEERGGRVTPLAYDYDSDRWSGSFVVDTIGRWIFTIEAWADVFASWRRELEKFLQAGADVRTDLQDGAKILERVARRARGEARQALLEAAHLLRDNEASMGARTAAALDATLEELVAAHVDLADMTRYDRWLAITVDRPEARFAAWYEMFPRSQAVEEGRHGTFVDAERTLPRIASLGFDVVYLPPIHPIGTTHRKGRNNALVAEEADPGSPWAIGGEEGGHTAVAPELGTLDDFERFVQSARALGLEIALDYALQCSPDHPWVREHPDWFFVRADGSIMYAQNPPKKYEDIYPLNFWCEDRDGLWNACKDILLFWIDRGVRTFRVDNPHTKPLAFWEWVIAEVQREHPDVILLSEAFTRPKRMKGLAKLGFTQSYTYFTWRNTPAEVREYLTELTRTETAEYLRGNLFVNTPDILHEYLQRGGRPAFLVRLLLAATLSPLYGMYSGYELCESVPRHAGSEEYLNSEKYEVRFRDWNAPGNINAEVARINRIRRENPALRLLTNLTFHPSENDRILFYHKTAPGNDLLIAVSLDPFRTQEAIVHVPLKALGVGEQEPFVVDDLLSGERYLWRGVRNYVKLDPREKIGHVLLVRRPGDREPGT